MAMNNQQSCLQVNRYTGFIILLLLHLSCPVVIYVDTCPNDMESWVDRSKNFLCKDPNERYHCIQSISGHLVETCMKSYVIKSHKVGCPLVRIHDRTSHLHYPFLRCNTTNHGCPKPFHRGYSTNELYLYPACIYPGGNTTYIRRDSAKEIHSTCDSKEIHTAEFITKELKWIAYTLLISIGLFILGICIVNSVRWFYVHLQRVLPATSHNIQRYASVRNYKLSEVDNRNTEFSDHASNKTIRARNVTIVNTAEQELPDNAELCTNGES